MISFCCTIHNRAAMLAGLLDSLAKLDRRDWELVVADFQSTDACVETILEAAHFNGRVITVAESFSRSRGLNLAAAHATGERLFFTDTDMTFPADFLERLDRLVKPGRAYFPIFYSLHADKEMTVRGNSRDSAEANGWWRRSSFGMCGFLRDDFEAVGRWDERFTIWGEEDVELLRRTSVRQRVHRKRCPGLFHRWHYENRWGH